MKPSLKNLPLSIYSFLDKLGLLYELYPEATGNWRFDCPEPKPLKLEEFNGTHEI